MTLDERDEHPDILRLGELEAERDRIEALLREYLTPEEARIICNQLFDWAIELDEIAEAIQEHPAAEDLAFDGSFFTFKDPGRHGFFVSYDGLRLLQAIRQTNIRTFLGDHVVDGKEHLMN